MSVCGKPLFLNSRCVLEPGHFEPCETEESLARERVRREKRRRFENAADGLTDDPTHEQNQIYEEMTR